MKDQQKLLQDNLLEAMQEQYQTRVARLEQDLLKLEQDRQKDVGKSGLSQINRTKIEEQYKTKQKDLEKQVNVLKQKEKDAVQKQKQFEM